MVKRLKFAITYAFRNMWRNRQRTAFALFSIAAGVATVVALRMLGLMLTDALTSNVRGFLRGDITAETANQGPTVSLLNKGVTRAPFNTQNISQIDAWAK